MKQITIMVPDTGGMHDNGVRRVVCMAIEAHHAWASGTGKVEQATCLQSMHVGFVFDSPMVYPPTHLTPEVMEAMRTIQKYVNNDFKPSKLTQEQRAINMRNSIDKIFMVLKKDHPAAYADIHKALLGDGA